MARAIDHDGKSQTSSAADRDHYPEPSGDNPPIAAPPAPEQIARLANELWRARGCPAGTADQDWFEAEQRLLQLERDKAGVAAIHERGGSVQS